MSVISAAFRSRVRAGVEPIARLLGRVGLTPNMLTLIGLGIAIVGAYLVANGYWLVGGLVVAFGAIFDLFDGALARATGTVSKFGAFLDSTLDRAGEGVVYIAIVIAAYDSQNVWLAPMAISAMTAGYMVSYVRSRAESLGFSPGTGMASVGLAPREVRTAILVVGLFTAGLLIGSHFADCPAGMSCPQLWSHVLVGALALITVLSIITTIQRILFTYNQSRSQNQEVNH